MREIRLSGSEGGGPGTTRSSLPRLVFSTRNSRCFAALSMTDAFFNSLLEGESC